MQFNKKALLIAAVAMSIIMCVAATPAPVAEEVDSTDNLTINYVAAPGYEHGTGDRKIKVRVDGHRAMGEEGEILSEDIQASMPEASDFTDIDGSGRSLMKSTSRTTSALTASRRGVDRAAGVCVCVCDCCYCYCECVIVVFFQQRQSQMIEA